MSLEDVNSKGDLMKYIYSEAELKKIDSAIPVSMWETHRPIRHVMNYNVNVFGQCEDLFQVAKLRGIELPRWVITIRDGESINDSTDS